MLQVYTLESGWWRKHNMGLPQQEIFVVATVDELDFGVEEPDSIPLNDTNVILEVAQRCVI